MADSFAIQPSISFANVKVIEVAQKVCKKYCPNRARQERSDFTAEYRSLTVAVRMGEHLLTHPLG